MAYYKITNGKAQTASKSHGANWIQFDPLNKPQELIDAEKTGLDEIRDKESVLYNEVYYSSCFGCLIKLTAINSILTNPTDSYIVKDYYNNDVTLQKTDVRNIIELILTKQVI